MTRLIETTVRFWRSLFPNAPLAVIAFIAFVSEMVFHALRPDSVLGGAEVPWGFASVAIFALWVMTAWVVSALLGVVVGVSERYPRAMGYAVRAVCAALCVAAAIIYGLSWTLYHQIGRFANVEALLFAVENPVMTLWLDLTGSERLTVALVSIAFLPATVVLAWGMPRLARIDTLETGSRLRERFVCFAGVAAMLWICWQPIRQEPSVLKYRVTTQRLANGLTPSVTFLTSFGAMVNREPIAANLDSTLLRPLDPHFEVVPRENPNRPSIVFIQIESLRSDVIGRMHQGREIVPSINALANRATVFENAYAQSTHSDYADVCIVSSLYPLRTRHHHYYRRDDPWPKTLAFDAVKPAGYTTAIISSQNESWGSMNEFLDVPALDYFFDAGRSGLKSHISARDPGMAYEYAVGGLSAGKLHDRDTIDEALRWIETQADADTPFFLNINLQSSHFPYELPEGASQPFQPCALSEDVHFMSYPAAAKPAVWNAYCNALHEADRHVGRLIAFCKARRLLDNMVFVVLGENGESFHEEGQVGHAQAPVESAVHTALVVYGPKWFDAGARVNYPIEHVDLLPTIAGKLGWRAHPNWQGIDIFADDAPRREERLLFHHTNTGVSQVDAVQWGGDWKYLLDRETGAGRLHRLADAKRGVIDRTSEHPQVAAMLRSVLQRWQRQQLAYYHHPIYFREYYPPRAPRLHRPSPAATGQHDQDTDDQ